MKDQTNDKKKTVKSVGWSILIFSITIFGCWIIYATVPVNYLTEFFSKANSGQIIVLDETFLHQYQFLYFAIPILLIFAVCILCLLVSLMFKKYKKADWIFAIVCIVVVMAAVILSNIPKINRAINATCEVQEVVVEDKFITDNRRIHRIPKYWLKLSDGNESSVYYSMYENTGTGDTVYVAYLEDFNGQIPVVFSKENYSIPG